MTTRHRGSLTPPATASGGPWLSRVIDPAGPRRPCTPLVGVLPGEGVGPEVIDGALEVLRGLERAGGRAVALEVGGRIGLDAEKASGSALPEDVVRFCAGIFDRGGAILSGPGGGRYVYDLRKRFDLFLKIAPVQAGNGLLESSPIRPERLKGIDILVLRENLSGIYQGSSDVGIGDDGLPLVRHTFSYGEGEVSRFLDAAARLASSRRGELTVVTKLGGFPALSGLWRRCGIEAAERFGVACSVIDLDLMAYELVRRPRSFDVVAASNLGGDLLGDLAAILIGSRALSFSGNFSPRGDAVYQTNHGAAYDIAGLDRANPAGQILSLAMLLRESFGWQREAGAIEEGIRRVWADGWRTADVAAPDRTLVGTREMASLIASAAAESFVAAAG